MVQSAVGWDAKGGTRYLLASQGGRSGFLMGEYYPLFRANARASMAKGGVGSWGRFQGPEFTWAGA